MTIRLAIKLALLLCVAPIRPAPVSGHELELRRAGEIPGSGVEHVEERLAQATPITVTVFAVVRNQGTTLHDRPNGQPMQTLVGGSLLTARLRSQDNVWVLVETRDQIQGWVEVSTLLAAGLSRLPVEQPTATPTSTATSTSTPTPTSTPAPATATDSASMAEVTATGTAEPAARTDATPAATGAPTTPETTAETTPQGEGPEPGGEATAETTPQATPEPTPGQATVEPSPTPTQFAPPDGPTALALARIGGANLWSNEDAVFVAYYRAGSRLTALFRTDDDAWYFVYDDDGVHGWTSTDELLVVSGDSLPIEEFLAISGSELITDDATDGSATPTPTATGTDPEKVVATVNDFGLRLNIRAGPGTRYEIISKAVAGVAFNAIGRNQAGSWVQVAIVDLPSGYGWVSADYVTVDGPLEQLPVVEQAETNEEGNSPPP